jgi:AbrB family looped-hinge helix DNA binding protein
MRRYYYTKITRKGQITVPSAVRREWEVGPGERLAVVVDDGVVTLEPLGQITARTAGIFADSAIALPEDVLRSQGHEAWAEAAAERDEQTKS